MTKRKINSAMSFSGAYALKGHLLKAVHQDRVRQEFKSCNEILATPF